MANWCTTDYYYVGEKDKAQKLYDDIKDRIDKARGLRKAGKNSNNNPSEWLGNIVELIDEKWEDISCRGEILDYSEPVNRGDNNYSMFISTDTAWIPCYELMKKLADKYGLKHYFYTEEAGVGIYDTNDSIGLFFPERFKVIREDEDEFVDTFNDVADIVERVTGKRPADMENAESICDDYSYGGSGEENDDYIAVVEVDVVESVSVYDYKKERVIDLNVKP